MRILIKINVLMAIILMMMIGQVNAKTMYVLNSGSSTVSKIDLVDHSVNNSFIQTGLYSNQVHFSGDNLWLVNSGDNNIKGYNRESGTFIKSYDLENSTNPWNMLETDTHFYVTGFLNKKLFQINKNTDEIKSLEVGFGPAGMLIHNNHLYVACSGYSYPDYNPGKVAVIDLETFTKTQEISVSLNPQVLVYYEQNIYVLCTGDYNAQTGKADVIDPENNTVTNTINIGSYPNTMSVEDHKLYFGDGMSAGFFVYDLNAQSFINSTTNPYSPGGSLILFDQGLKYILKASFTENSRVEVRNTEDVLIREYVCALGAVDMKIYSSGTANNDISVKPISMMSYPNPFKQEITIKAQDPSVEEICIFNIKGQKVISGKGHQLIWNGKNSKGNPCGNGIYFSIAKKNGQIVSKKTITLLK